MNKRTFLKKASALAAAPFVSPLISWMPQEKIKNWAGNITYSTDRLFHPASTQQVQEMVKKYARQKVLGTRHCFNTIADSAHNLVALDKLDQVVHLDPVAKTVEVQGGIRYGQLAEYLHQKGFALHNLASLPHISVAGACTTATHGSGIKNGNLATAVRALELVTADGSIHRFSREKDAEKFQAVVVGLGAFGVLTKITLDVLPTYQVRQVVYEHLPFEQLANHFHAIVSAGYSVSLFTDWSQKSFNEVWVKSKVVENEPFSIPSEFYQAKPATRNLHPIADISAENCTEQMGVPGPWHERLPHFKMGFTPSSGVELQSEYFVPLKHGVEAIMAVSKLSEQIVPHIFISEIRTIDADPFWMSPCYQQPCMALHFTWKQDWPAVQKLLPQIERELAPFQARPHWGKLFTVPPASLHELYSKLPDFVALAKQYDPSGKFRNEFLDRYIFS